MKSNDTLTPLQSLEVINEMINVAKTNISKNSFFFLTWGWIMTFAGIGEYILQHVVFYKFPFIIWPVSGALGGALSFIYGYRQRQQAPVQNFTDRFIASTWVGYIITLILLIICTVGNKLNPSSFIIVLTGFPTFVTGAILRFKPLIAGGVFFWLIGFVSFFCLAELTALLFSLSIVLGYLVPGYLLRSEEKRQNLLNDQS